MTGACLLHHDFHVMAQDCWGATIGWFAEHMEMPDDARRNAYQAAVERGMLNGLRPIHLPGDDQ